MNELNKSKITGRFLHVLSKSTPFAHMQWASTSPTTSAAPVDHVWQRWIPLSHGIFYAILVFTLIHSPVHSATLLGLTTLMGIWYGLCIFAPFQYLRSHTLLSMGYLIIGWGFWFALTLLDPFYLFLLFGLYPQIFFFRPVPWMIFDTFILTILSLWRQALLPGGFDSGLLITLVATPCGLLMALFIDAIIRQSREQHRLLGELEMTRHELALAERQAGITQERQRLAREIHDTLVQGFSSIVMHLEAAEAALPAEISTLQRHLDQARRTARDNLVEGRRLMWALQPEVLCHVSLPEALTNLVWEWSEVNRVQALATITGTSRSLLPEIESTLLRAAQETLTNAGKYAHAQRVTVTLSYMDEVVVLDVQDDGSGFDSAQLHISPPEQPSSGFGLKALRQRVELLGGTLSIESSPGEGTTIAVALPAMSTTSLLRPKTAKEVRP
ncbi:MAG TPA: sensor histidine kinase [Ktedonobacteraceae bacterium]|nr:sensor histidine kinase [Ktedonobacteraceae bacterium]